MVPLGSTAAVSAADTGIHIYINIAGSGTTALINSNEEMEDIMKTIKSLQDSGLLLKGAGEAI